MEEAYTGTESRPAGKRAKRWGLIVWLTIEWLFDKIVDALGEYVHIMRGESELFLGVGLTVIGLLNFQNGKNCDGNTADYLSCTRPSTYYYFGWLEIALVVVGAFLLILWYLKLQHRHAHRE